MKKYIMWQTCTDLNKINYAIQTEDENWEGLKSADQIISISWDEHLGCYIVFWSTELTRT